MGDRMTLAKARQELEDLYSGVPDESVDLTFKDYVSFQQEVAPEKKATITMKAIHEEPKDVPSSKALSKLPSLDFNMAIQQARDRHRPVKEELTPSHYSRNHSEGSRSIIGGSPYYGGASPFSTASPMSEKGGRRRPGIPHSNICALCKEYIYLFRNRCLVCGRVYCKKCVAEGMGEMSEGRKCVDCLGSRFSQRYIERAGKTGCCLGYPSEVKQQELKWAERGPRTNSESQYRRNRVASRSPSPVKPTTPTRSNELRSRSPTRPRTAAAAHFSNDPPSFVMTSPFSPHHHGFPL